ncbi:MAG: DUF4438 domain-containing protein [Candidatus Bathyarchaeia archaeon]
MSFAVNSLVLEESWNLAKACFLIVRKDKEMLIYPAMMAGAVLLMILAFIASLFYNVYVFVALIMGSGLGADQTYSGDYDIQMFDESVVKEYGLEDLRLGDLVAIQDADSSYGRVYLKGAVTIGIVVHSNCVISGYGPGVITLLTSRSGKIVPRISADANIARILNLK